MEERKKQKHTSRRPKCCASSSRFFLFPSDCIKYHMFAIFNSNLRLTWVQICTEQAAVQCAVHLHAIHGSLAHVVYVCARYHKCARKNTKKRTSRSFSLAGCLRLVSTRSFSLSHCAILHTNITDQPLMRLWYFSSLSNELFFAFFLFILLCLWLILFINILFCMFVLFAHASAQFVCFFGR